MKLLLVDDHPLFRDGMALLLSRLDPTVESVQAGNCDEALARMAGVELVLMDIGLPGASGLEGIALLRERHPGVPVIALSSQEDRQTVLRALDLGAMGFIPKSSDTEVMIAAVRLVLARGIYLPAAVLLGEDRPDRRIESTAPSTGKRAALRPSDLGLTERQSHVLYLILQGKSAKVISRELGLAPSTVKVHTSAVLRALNVTTRTQAVIAASRLGLTFTPGGDVNRPATG
jgi:DNA-binding NarL/FixJ family response regulator